jgi:hypothetical protein
MKNVLWTVVLLAAVPAVAGPPAPLWIQSSGAFDANRIYSGTFVGTGAISDRGTLVDSPNFKGAAIHVVRTMTTSGRESITLEINGNHVSGSYVLPTWCPPPAVIPAGTVLVAEGGNWRLLSASGKYAGLQGGGAWATWVVVDPALSQPLTASDCLSGQVH